MSQEDVVQALKAELEQAMASVRAARRMVAELTRAPVGRPPRSRATSDVAAARDLRYTGMTVAEAALVLELSEEHLRRLLRRGNIDGIPYGGRTGWRLRRDYVLGIRDQIDAAKEGKAAARRRLFPGPRPVGRPRKSVAQKPPPR